MSKRLYETGRDGLRQFIRALAEVIENDVQMTDDEAAGVPMLLFRAETQLLQTWDKICCVQKKEERDD